MKLVIDPHILEKAFKKPGEVYVLLTDEILEAMKKARNSANDDLKPTDSLSIFLSYKREDHKQVDGICRYLRRRGHRPWFDTDELDLGNEWEQKLVENINRADLFLWCASYRSVGFNWHVTELNLALQKDRQKWPGWSFIMPVRLQDVKLPEIIKGINYIDMFDHGYDKLIKAINNEIIRRRGDVVPHKVAHTLSLCVDERDDDGEPLVHKRYAEALKDAEGYETWIKKLMGIKDAFYSVRVEAGLNPDDKDAIASLSCRSSADDLFLELAYVESDTALVTDECRQGHNRLACGTIKYLREEMKVVVYDVNDARYKLSEYGVTQA